MYGYNRGVGADGIRIKEIFVFNLLWVRALLFEVGRREKNRNLTREPSGMGEGVATSVEEKVEERGSPLSSLCLSLLYSRSWKNPPREVFGSECLRVPFRRESCGESKEMGDTLRKAHLRVRPLPRNTLTVSCSQEKDPPE